MEAPTSSRAARGVEASSFFQSNISCSNQPGLDYRVSGAARGTRAWVRVSAAAEPVSADGRAWARASGSKGAPRVAGLPPDGFPLLHFPWRECWSWSCLHFWTMTLTRDSRWTAHAPPGATFWAHDTAPPPRGLWSRCVLRTRPAWPWPLPRDVRGSRRRTAAGSGWRCVRVGSALPAARYAARGHTFVLAEWAAR
jgi:hypothetical protein